MQATKILFSHDLYLSHLSIINNIYFTVREIDMMACILSARKTSKIAYFLSINPRTVETHIRNIMAKLKCNTREGIIDFLESSDKILFLRQYYSLLQIEATFKKSLKEIAKLNKEKNCRCLLLNTKDKGSLTSNLESHLNLVGVTVSSAIRKTNDLHIIFVFPNTLEEKKISLFLQKCNSSRVLIFLREKNEHQEIPKEFRIFEAIDLTKQDYYFSFFAILKKLLPHLNFDKIIAEFKDKYKTLYLDSTSQRIASNEKSWQKPFTYKINFKFLLIISFIFGYSGYFLIFHWSEGNKNLSIRSDLFVPTESALLNRPELLAQLDARLKSAGGIRTVALVGVGGAGKTTLSRQYAHQQNANVVWEINAETKENLSRSFWSLAQALSKTENDQKILKALEEIKNPIEREEKVTQFVKEHLKEQSNWILIFDNVEKFTDIQERFPHDVNTWGQGKIILTTRDGNIENNPHVDYVVLIGELDVNQKLILFTKIMNHGKSHLSTSNNIEEIKAFLEEIPPFPLDISIAAYYLKSTNISYKEYIKNLKEPYKNFEEFQENIIKETGNYSKTRFNIVTLSLQHIIKFHKDFADLLLFISMLDSQNIPRNLLEKYKDSAVVDNFIYNLKKYSLITSESSPYSEITLSIHRSTQEIILDSLTKIFNLEKNQKTIQSIANTMAIYTTEITDKADFSRMKLLITHCTKFLTHEDLLQNSIEGLIKGELGRLFLYLDQDKKAKQYLEEGLECLEKSQEKNNIKISQFLSYLGVAYRELGNYQKAKELLEGSLINDENTALENQVNIAWALVNLGNVYREFGEYEKAKKVIKKGITIYNNYYGHHHDKVAHALIYLGDVYRTLGEYKKTKDYYEESLKILKHLHGDDHINVAWVSVYLGNLYVNLGSYAKAEDLFTKSLAIYKKYFSENNVMYAWAAVHLGNTYTNLGIPKKAINILSKAVTINSNYYGKDHIKTSWASVYLGDSYNHLGNHLKAKNILEDSFKVHQRHFGENHIKLAWVSSKLANVYKNLKDYAKARAAFEKSLITYEKHYSKNHIETARILRDLGQNYFFEGQLEIAKDFTIQALKIFQQGNHPESYMALENLAEIYLTESVHMKKKENIQQSQSLKTQAINYLKQALEIAKVNLPVESFHLARIHAKLKKIEDSY